MITNDVSNYITLLLRIAHIICNHPVLICMFFNDAVSTALVLSRRMKWEDDNEWRVDKDLEGGGSDLFEVIMPIFTWRD
jgi:hypothetical protein